MSDNPGDPLPLTPAHFVLAKSILPQPIAENVMDEPDNKLTCFGQRQKLLQQFWRRWREEYLSDKQQRAKWYKIEENLQIGDVVIIRNENLPPAVWALGRVKEIFKADDGLVRTAMVKTALENSSARLIIFVFFFQPVVILLINRSTGGLTVQY